MKEATDYFKTSRFTIARIWKQIKDNLDDNTNWNLNSKRKGNCGRKAIDWSANLAVIKEVPFMQRGTIRGLSGALGIPTTSLFHLFKRGDCIKRESNFIKPLLNDENKIQRLRFCLGKLQPNGLIFKEMFDVIHVDEKWFYFTKEKRKIYLAADEDSPSRHCKSKRFITKVMFFTAVARPKWDPHKKRLFDGKIGIWPFVTTEPAPRASKNRPRGTLIKKPVTSVKKVQVKRMFLDNLFPAIRDKMPVSRKNSIKIQLDNASPHGILTDQEIIEDCNKEGWNIHFKPQPPNSPDLNVLDLGFFNSIQSLQHQAQVKTVEELISAVQDAYWSLSKETLDDIFLTLQKTMELIMKNRGGNNFKLNHMNKAKLRSEGSLSTAVVCDLEAIGICRESLGLEN